MTIDFKALAAKAAAIKDQTVAQTGGGDYVPPAAGFCKLRLVGYVELGKHVEEFKGVKKTREKVQLTFEVSGKNHPPVEIDGVKKPILVTLEETLSLNEKARFYKLFTRLNYQGKAKHMSELLGEPFMGEIIHRKYKRRDGSEGTAVELYNKDDSAYTIKPPRTPKLDEENMPIAGEFNILTVDPALTPFRLFLWDFADLDQWATVFVDGEYPERKNDKGEVTAPAKSKNVTQNKVKLAVNFAGSPIQAALLAAGHTIDIPDAEAGRDDSVTKGEEEETSAAQAAKVITKALEGAAATDALNGIA